MASSKAKPRRVVSAWDVIVISLVAAVVVALGRASTSLHHHASPVLSVREAPPRTPAEAHLGTSATWVGTELYGSNDPLIFFQCQWPQNTMAERIELGKALFRLNRALKVEWEGHLKALAPKALWLYQCAERDRGTPPDPHPVLDPEWPALMDWYARVGRRAEYPTRVWDNLDSLFEEFIKLSEKANRTPDDVRRLSDLLRFIGSEGVGFRYVFKPDGSGYLDLTAPIAESSSLASVINLRKINKALVEVR